jgi:hypothetical protein
MGETHVATAVVVDVVVDRNGHRGARGEGGEMVVEQRPVERVGVVEVEREAFVARSIAQVDVVGVQLDQGDVPFAGHLGEPLGDGGLPRRRPSRDTDQERPHRQFTHESVTILRSLADYDAAE